MRLATGADSTHAVGAAWVGRGPRRFFRVDFSVGTRIVRKDRRAPFVHTVTVAAGSTPGSSVTVRARAFIKVKRGRGPKKSIRSTVRVC